MRTFYAIKAFPNYFVVAAQNEEQSENEFEVLENPSFMKLVNFLSEKELLVGFRNHVFDDVVVSSMMAKAQEEKYPMNEPMPPMWAYTFAEELNNNEGDKYFSGLKQPTEDVIKYRDFETQLNLKSFESVLGMDIVESSYDFHEPLDEEGIKSVLAYCKHDVVAARRSFNLLEERGSVSAVVNLRNWVADRLDMPPETLLKSSANSMLIKLFKNPSYNRQTFFDYIERCDFAYAFADEKFVEWYEKIIHWADDPLKLDTPELEFVRNGVEYKFALGGGHGHNEELIFSDCEHDDFESLYPMIMIRILALGTDCTALFQEIVNTRLHAKRVDRDLAIALKLIINSIYGLCRSSKSGAQLFNKYLGLDVCIVGQVMLYDLALRFEALGATIINVNTDGIIYKNNGNGDAISAMTKDFSERVGINLASEHFDYYFAQHVNSYFILDADLNVIEKKGWFSAKPYSNNLASPKYVIDYFRATIDSSKRQYASLEYMFEDDPLSFTLRAKNTKNFKFCYGVTVEHDRFGKRGEVLKKKGEEFYPYYTFGKQFRGYATKNGHDLRKTKVETGKHIAVGTLKTNKVDNVRFNFTATRDTIDVHYYQQLADEVIDAISSNRL